MTPSELLKSYNFHDSTIRTLRYQEATHTLIMYLTFCAWMQDDYLENNPKVIPATLRFHAPMIDAECLENYCNTDILCVHLIRNDAIAFVLLDDDHTCLQLQIDTQNVEFHKGADFQFYTRHSAKDFSHLSNNRWFEVYMLIDGINILEYRDEPSATLTWDDLDELFEFLESTLRFIEFDAPFPYDVEGITPFEQETNTFARFKDDTPDEFVEHDTPVHEWMYNHSWGHACAGVMIHHMIFCKKGDYIQISWNNEGLANPLLFKHSEGITYVSGAEYRQVITNAVDEYRKLLEVS